MQIFETIRIVDFTQGMAGGLATMIFADYGADVIRLEPPGGDPMWEHPAYLLWQRGKRSVAPDWSSAEDRARVRSLVSGADIFIESLPPGEAAALGLDYESLRRENPALIHFSLSAFGQIGPYRHYRAYDGIINAKTGRMREQVGWQKLRPTFRAVNDVSYHSAMFAVQATIAALRVRQMTGRGQKLDGTLLSGVTAPNNPWRRFEGQPLPTTDLYPGEISKEAAMRGELVPDRHESDPYTAVPTQLCGQCADGRWIMHSHLQQELFNSWIDAIGFSWIRDDPRFRDAPRFASNEDRIALNLLIFARLKEKTSAEWRDIYRQFPDCAGEIMQTTQEALAHEQFRTNGHVVEIDDPRVGRMKQLGPFARMSETPARIDQPAPLPGQHTEEVFATLRTPPVTAGTGGTPIRPLEGIVVLEVASWLAAPFSGSLLADLGARVIKVEPLSGDPYRKMFTNENMIRSFQGKENIAVNLKSAEGQAILHDLVAHADLIMHNFRPGVPERLNMDYATLKAIKPDIVYVYAGSYGSTGPDSARAAFNPTMGAFSGNSVFQSGAGNIPKGDQSPDPIAGSGVATGMMLGLAARVLTGKGQYVETSMMNSNVYCNSDDAFAYEGKPPRRAPGQDQIGLEATYRLYETAEGWLFLAIQFDAEFVAFCELVGRFDLATDPRFADWRGRIDNQAALSAELEPLFKTRSAEEWERVLTRAGLGGVRADGPGHIRFLHDDPQARAIGIMVPAQSRAFRDLAPEGRYWRHAPVVKFSETPCEEGKPYLGLGEHTEQVLSSFGYTADEIERLSRTGVIGLAADRETVETVAV